MQDLAEFIEERWSGWYRLAHLLAGANGHADDLLQVAMTKVVRSWDRIAVIDDPDAYVRRIVANTAIDLYRSNTRHSAIDIDDAPFKDRAPGFDDRLIQRADLWPLIARLPTRQRAIIVLRYYEDLSEAQIADVLGCARGTVKSQASAALHKLRQSVPSRTEGEHR